MAVKFLNIGHNVSLAGFLRVFLIVALCLIVLFFLFLPDYTKLKKLKDEQKSIRAQIEDLERNIAKLKRGNDRLSKDSAYSEEILRDKLGLFRKGDIVIKVENSAGQ